ncbi:hypothetical protein ACFOQM_16180 [Paenibacillus sp. GCM10012307]|uniref:Uncharacterized protein n=1 Tax=Paenibacillus roseus TaxID=2798579 RepID=A0A934J993_9BACL|nr:hypothetical protein [Paenibacillus roseus]MBJ6362782.1 hypothetical protein [Paenibacillus roseus]
MANYICPVCGFDCLEDEPYINDGDAGAGSFEICPCCKFQFGYDQRSKIPEYRENWIAKGAKWFDKDEKPDNWSSKDQLRRINIKLN